MTDIESSALIDYQYFREKGDWERARFQALCSVQPWSKKQLKPQDLMKFQWENTAPEPIDEEELHNLELKAKKLERKWQAM